MMERLLRIGAGIAFLSTIFLFPWWVVLALGGVLLIRYRNFVECIAALFLYDVLYGYPVALFFDFPYPYTLVGVIVFALRYFLEKKLFVRGSFV